MTQFRFTVATAEEAGFSSALLDELDRYYDTLVASGDLPGHVMLLARGDKLVRGHVTGYADWASKAPLHPDAVFTLFSMSKPFAAVAMLLLQEEGMWDLDDPVSKHLPEFARVLLADGNVASREPTLREVFTHTAGLTFGKTPEQMMARLQSLDWSTLTSLDELIARYADFGLDYEPGASWAYSGATDLQAAIVQSLTGERYDVFLKRRVFDPLGMFDTAFALDAPRTRRLVTGHVLDPETGRLREAAAAERIESIFPMGGTSFKSTALDYARFARMLLNRGTLGDVRVLKPESVDLMLGNQLSESFMETAFPILHYTIGRGNGHALNGMVCVDPERAERPVGKGTYEWGGAFGTWFWIDPEHDILCVGMTHRQRIRTDPRPPEVVAQELVYRALLDKPLRETPRA